MFRRNDDTLEYLAAAYDAYKDADWDYDASTPYGGRSGELVEKCIANYKFLEKIAARIGEGLIHNEEHAETAVLLMERLLKHGFKDGLYKDEIQNNFRKFYSNETINGLIDGTLKMSDNMKSFYSVAQTKILRRK